jgi:hypothetical protein
MVKKLEPLIEKDRVSNALEKKRQRYENQIVMSISSKSSHGGKPLSPSKKKESKQIGSPQKEK